MEISELLCTTREQRLAEVGTKPPCPFCGRPRVERSTYIRCNPCELNWGEDQDIFKHPLARTTAIEPTKPDPGDTAQTAK